MAIVLQPIVPGEHYATRDDLELKMGKKIVDADSNVATDTRDADEDRIDAALADADRRIDDFLRQNGIVTPVADATFRDSLVPIAVTYAYAYLVEPRVFVQSQPGETGVGREVFFAVKRANARLQRLALFGCRGLQHVDAYAPTAVD